MVCPIFSSSTQVLLSLEHGVWAPNLHYTDPNPDIPALTNGQVQVVDRPLPVRGGIVGINSFGFGGSNVHVILRPAAKAANSKPPRMVPRLLQACGRTETAVNAVLQKGKEHSTDDSFLSLLNGVSGAPSMPYRGYTLLGSQSDISEVQMGQAAVRPLWYICSGNSSHSDESHLHGLSDELFCWVQVCKQVTVYVQVWGPSGQVWAAVSCSCQTSKSPFCVLMLL